VCLFQTLPCRSECKIRRPVTLQISQQNLCAVRQCIKKFRDWPPGARTANGTGLCH
jgi:hypothetical protein